jgi:FkbM family methyltransferase
LSSLSWRISVWLSRCRHTARYLVALPFAYRNWWAVFQSKLGADVVLELRDGTRFHVQARTTDLAAVNEAVILNPYLSSGGIVLREDAIVVDIGANIGDFTVLVARRCPRGRVVAVEPVTRSARVIAAQVALNRLSNVTVVRAAVGAASRTAAIDDAGMSSRVVDGVSGDAVPVVTLERLMSEQHLDTVDLLKLDCEGAEWDILPAAAGVLPRVQQIAMEFHGERGWTAERLAEWLRERGYVVTHTGGEWNGVLWATRNGGEAVN